MPRKAGFLTDRMLPGLGIDRLNAMLSAGLARRGWDAFIHAGRADPDLAPEGVRVRPLPHIRSRRAPVADMWAPEALPALSAEADVRWVLTTPPWYALTPWLHDTTILHGGSSPPTGLGWKGLATYLYREVSQDLCWFPFATRIVTISRFLEGGLPAWLRHKTFVVEPGWDHYGPADPEEAGALRDRVLAAASGARRLLLYLGRLNVPYQPYKGLMDLVEIAAGIPGAHLVCAGFGDERDVRVLRDLGCTVLPNHPSAEMAALIAAADCVVMASRWEGYGLPAAEAQAQGTPIAALDRGALREVVADGVSGLLAPDVPGLAAAVERILSDRALAESLGAAGRERAEAHGWEAAVDAFAEALA